MLSILFWGAAGLVALIVGAEILVRGGGALAARMGVSPLLIGLTFVAIGTSAPELAVGIDSAVLGNGELAVGNIAGTNIVNTLLILGLSAAIRPLKLRMRTVHFDLPVMVMAAVALLVLASDGALSRLDGAVLVCGAVAYTAAVVWTARREHMVVKSEFHREYIPRPAGGIWTYGVDLLLLTGGIAIVVIGADWLVESATALALLSGVSDAVIGLTIVAIGTSAPELVTTIMSTIKGDRDIAIGNLLGSSIYNILAILGITCLVPSAPVEVGPILIHVDIPVMVAVTVLCLPVFLTGREVSRLEGGIAVTAYGSYIGYLMLARI